LLPEPSAGGSEIQSQQHGAADRDIDINDNAANSPQKRQTAGDQKVKQFQTGRRARFWTGDVAGCDQAGRLGGCSRPAAGALRLADSENLNVNARKKRGQTGRTQKRTAPHEHRRAGCEGMGTVARRGVLRRKQL
jgi:hypothetical protein